LLQGATPAPQVFVTGHSLGAAVAVHCAAELGASSHSLGYPIDGVYTYGQPRVGNQAFADFYMVGTQVSWRVTHHRDPVPHLPPMSLCVRQSPNRNCLLYPAPTLSPSATTPFPCFTCL